MGTLAYGHLEHFCTIDDRVLRHLQIVIIAKLRRGERFPFSFVESGSKVTTTLWMSPDIPIRFELTEFPASEINREWVAVLSRAAQQGTGLQVLDEPPSLRVLPEERRTGELVELRA